MTYSKVGYKKIVRQKKYRRWKASVIVYLLDLN